MNWRAVSAIVRKDIKIVSQNKGVVIPIIILPVILFGALPWIAAFAPHLINIGGNDLAELAAMIERMPAGLQTELAPYTFDQQAVIFFLVYILAPMFLVVPLMVASVMAADSFAGERERRTLETLLYSPTTDRELFVAKLLSSWLSAITVTIAGFLLYTLMANLAAWRTIGHIFFPNWMWIALVFWVSPAAAGFGLTTMVVVSGKAQGFQDAYQMGSAVVIPVLLLLFGQIAGVMYFSIYTVLLLGFVFWLIDIALVSFGIRIFRRGRLIAKV